MPQTTHHSNKSHTDSVAEESHDPRSTQGLIKELHTQPVDTVLEQPAQLEQRAVGLLALTEQKLTGTTHLAQAQQIPIGQGNVKYQNVEPDEDQSRASDSADDGDSDIIAVIRKLAIERHETKQLTPETQNINSQAGLQSSVVPQHAYKPKDLYGFVFRVQTPRIEKPIRGASKGDITHTAETALNPLGSSRKRPLVLDDEDNDDHPVSKSNSTNSATKRPRADTGACHRLSRDNLWRLDEAVRRQPTHSGSSASQEGKKMRSHHNRDSDILVDTKTERSRHRHGSTVSRDPDNTQSKHCSGHPSGS